MDTLVHLAQICGEWRYKYAGPMDHMGMNLAEEETNPPQKDKWISAWNLKNQSVFNGWQ